MAYILFPVPNGHHAARLDPKCHSGALDILFLERTVILPSKMNIRIQDSILNIRTLASNFDALIARTINDAIGPKINKIRRGDLEPPAH